MGKCRFLVLFLTFVLFPFGVNALEVDTINEFVDALGGNTYARLESDGKTITLENDVVLGETLSLVGGEYILDLNGNEISDSDNNFVGDNLIYIESTNLTINDSVGDGGIYVINSDDRTVFVSNGELTINKAAVKGNWNALYSLNSKVMIDDGIFTGVNSSAMYAYGSTIEINNGTFTGGSDCLTFSTSTTTINNGEFSSFGSDNSIALSIDGGNLYINDGLFEANYIGAYIRAFDNSDIKIKGGKFVSLNTDNNNMNESDFVSAGITMNLSDGLDSTIDVTYLLADGYRYSSDSIRTYELREHGLNNYISATSSTVEVVPKNITITNNIENVTNSNNSDISFNTEYRTFLTAHAGYTLPEAIYILIDGGSELSTTSYSYDRLTGELVIPAEFVTGNIVIVGNAIRNEFKYKVIFDANLGLFTGDKTEFIIDEWTIGDEEKLEIPTRKGYKFLGFFTEKTGGTSLEKYIAEAGIDGNLTFYAQWEKAVEVPKTFDGIGITLLVGVLSLIGLVVTVMYLKKSNVKIK